ncbi:single-stranded-DNA-specific exonuclease RecJ [Patescibacteria group bacterium]|nr:single-stranded-DNA-specific exonuclease RecJ [Patescibacteria group bacterium]
MKKWIILEKSASGHKKDILGILLENRNIFSEKEKKEFLHPELSDLTLESVNLKAKELENAAKRIKLAIERKESVTVYTDYDADGVCGGAIVWETLYKLGVKTMPYVPHRVNEGYGLSRKGIDKIIEQFGTKLIVTVDHGVTAVKEVAYAKEKGIDTIILDHHILPKKLPDSVALIHTTSLASGGLAYFFSNFLSKHLYFRKNDLSKSGQMDKSKLDLAAIATVADLVPLLGANRVIVKYGIDEIKNTRRVGLRSLIKQSGLENGDVSTYEIGHILAPRINAMGRLMHAMDALRLLCTKDIDRAESLARKLSSTNRERQILTEKASLLAMDIVRNERIYKSEKGNNLIFVSHSQFQEGIIGLVAGKLTETYYRPSIVVSEGKEYSKASARSVIGLNIVEVIREAGDLLEDAGGHAMAAGFTVATKNINTLKKRLNSVVEEKLSGIKLERTLKIDAILTLDEITEDFYEKINTLSPFGVGNPEPVFAVKNAEIVGLSLVGREQKHIKMFMRQNDGGIIHQAVGFGMGEFFNKLYPHKLVDIAFSINIDSWNGSKRLQLKLKDVIITSKSEID